MIKPKLLIILIVLCSACHQNVKPKDQLHKLNSDTASSKTEKTKKVTIKTDSISINITGNNVKNLRGIWALKGDENAAFYIKKSVIYYPDHFKSYKYQINGDSIKIYYDDFNQSFNYNFKGSDTLILSGEEGENDYYRFKK